VIGARTRRATDATTALSSWPTTRRTIGLRGYTGLSIKRPAGDFDRGMSTSGVRSLSKGANAIRRWRDGGTTVTALIMEMIVKGLEVQKDERY